MPTVRPLSNECAIGRMHGQRRGASRRRSLEADERLLRSARRLRPQRSVRVAHRTVCGSGGRMSLIERAACVPLFPARLCVQAALSATTRIFVAASI